MARRNELRANYEQRIMEIDNDPILVNTMSMVELWQIETYINHHRYLYEPEKPYPVIMDGPDVNTDPVHIVRDQEREQMLGRALGYVQRERALRKQDRYHRQRLWEFLTVPDDMKVMIINFLNRHYSDIDHVADGVAAVIVVLYKSDMLADPRRRLAPLMEALCHDTGIKISRQAIEKTMIWKVFAGKKYYQHYGMEDYELIEKTQRLLYRSFNPNIPQL